MHGRRDCPDFLLLHRKGTCRLAVPNVAQEQRAWGRPLLSSSYTHHGVPIDHTAKLFSFSKRPDPYSFLGDTCVQVDNTFSICQLGNTRQTLFRLLVPYHTYARVYSGFRLCLIVGRGACAAIIIGRLCARM